MKTMVKTLIAIGTLLFLSIPQSVNGMATTYIVNTNDDIVDSAGCDTEHCSLREAILAAEQNVGADTILFDGDFVISPLELLPVITEKLIIDGSGHFVTLDGSDYLNSNSITCPAQFEGDRSHPGLVFYQADNSKVKSMEIANWCNGITVEETDGGEWTENLFSGNLGNAQLDFLNSNHNLTVGNVFWQDPVDPTLTSGDQVELQFSSWNFFSGNVFTGGEDAYELLFESNYNVVEGEVIESFFLGGIALVGDVRGNVIRNNNITNGVPMIVEGVAVFRGFANGITLAGNADENVVEGNVISNVPDSGIAVLFAFADTNEGNVIRNNTISHTGLAGIMVGGGTRNHLSGNLISSVDGIGIDLSDQTAVVPFFNVDVSFPDGVTPNDSGLAANNGQNYPVMDEDKSNWNNSLVVLKGKLQGADILPDRKFYVECFGNSSMVREGEVFLSSKTVITNEEGVANITMPVQTTDPLGNGANEMYVTCTATDLDGNTSELSEPIKLKKR